MVWRVYLLFRELFGFHKLSKKLYNGILFFQVLEFIRQTINGKR